MAVGTQENPFTVSSLTAEIKLALERGFAKVFVEGEISGFKTYPSGHAYFTLKDGGAAVSAVMFKGALERCRARSALTDGAKILAYGDVSVYAPRGNYQLVVRAARPVGTGDLMQRYLELKDRLEREGLFDESRKRPLPFLPRRVALVTSPAGAVVHDMCRVLMRRFPALSVRIFPALVQGASAPASLVAALRAATSQGTDGWQADLVIVARGGGSFEDLFCFNDETLVRTVADSPVPTVSAVGHETDFTLCDFAADRRAGTPSIAAELAVPRLDELCARLDGARLRMASSLRGQYQCHAQRADHLGEKLAAALRRAGETLDRRFETARRRLDAAAAELASRRLLASGRVAACESRLAAALRFERERAESRFARVRRSLELLSPYAVLERGYSLTTDASGEIVRDAAALAPGAELTTRLKSGSVRSTVVATIP